MGRAGGMGRVGGLGRGGAVLNFGTPGAFTGFGTPFGFGFGTGVFAGVRSPFFLGFNSQNFQNFGIPPLGGPLPSLGINGPGSTAFTGILAQDRFPGWSLPFFPYGYDYGYGGYDVMPPSTPNIIVIQPMTPEMMGAPQRPPQPARPEVREVNLPAEAAQPYPPAPLTPQQMFSIALRNGATDSAIAAWVQDDCLNYLNAAGRREQVAVSAVDRVTTARLNRDKNLSLWLPPE
jgi:hypothetical protein